MGGKGISGPDLSLTFLKEQEPVGYSHEGDMILQKGKSMSKSRGKSSTRNSGNWCYTDAEAWERTVYLIQVSPREKI